MSKNISVSDDVYEMLEREKGDRSFSEVIRDNLERGGSIADVAGEGVLGQGTYEEVKEEIVHLSDAVFEDVDEGS